MTTIERLNIIDFIHCFRSLPELWNTKDPMYRSRAAKTTAYQKLLNILRRENPNSTRLAVIRKINSLKSDFHKVVKSHRFGESSISLVCKPWYFHELSFLLSSKADDNTDINSKRHIDQYIENDCNRMEYDYTDKNFRLPDCRKTKLELVELMESDNDVNTLFSLPKNDEKEIMMMAQVYALKLSKMDPMQCLLADKLINDVLTEGQLGNLSRESSLKL